MSSREALFRQRSPMGRRSPAAFEEFHDGGTRAPGRAPPAPDRRRVRAQGLARSEPARIASRRERVAGGLASVVAAPQHLGARAPRRLLEVRRPANADGREARLLSAQGKQLVSDAGPGEGEDLERAPGAPRGRAPAATRNRRRPRAPRSLATAAREPERRAENGHRSRRARPVPRGTDPAAQGSPG